MSMSKIGGEGEDEKNIKPNQTASPLYRSSGLVPHLYLHTLAANTTRPSPVPD